jgi:hypothetical protein
MAREQQAPTTVQHSFFRLVAQHGHRPDPEIRTLVRLGAAVQHERHAVQVSDVEGLTRTVALWAVVHLDGHIAKVLESGGVAERQLGDMLSIRGVPSPADVDDVLLHDELARALTVAFALPPPSRTIRLLDVAIAVLRDAVTNGGLLASRLDRLGADVPAIISTLDAQGAPAAPPAISDATGLCLGFYEALRRERAPDVPKADTVDGPSLWPAFAYVTSQYRNTMATRLATIMVELHGQHSEKTGPSTDYLFDLSPRVAPIPLADIDVVDHPVLRAAVTVRDRVEPGEDVHLRHVIAVALVHGSGPFGPETRDRDVDELRAGFLDQLDHDAPSEVVARWRAFFAGTATGPPVGRAVASLDVDMVDDATELNDELEVARVVSPLCNVLAARGTVPPMAVGLFGRWGSGKSYVMALMRRQVDQVCAGAKAAKTSGKQTSYCTDIVQVTFNAWHYMDTDDLWATIAVELFAAIAQVDPSVDVQKPRAEIVCELKDLERKSGSVDRTLARALDDPRVTSAAASMGLGEQREQALGMVREVDTSRSHLSSIVTVVKKWPRWRQWAIVGLAGVGVIALAVLAALLVAGTVSVRSLVTWTTLAATGLGAATKWLRGVSNGLAQVNEVVDDLGLKPSQVTAEGMADGVAEDQTIRDLRDELARIDRLTSTREWLQQRAQSTDYTAHFGVISVLRGDLKALAEKQRRESEDRRIILYIDDLDRCEPYRVVQVLQAVHLLLALPLFMVVVGVDPRWLTKSLERHYRQVLAGGGAQSRYGDDPLTESTPHDYLDKIFQIPFSLPTMGPKGYQRLIAALARPAAQARPDGDGHGSGTGPVPPAGDGTGAGTTPRNGDVETAPTAPAAVDDGPGQATGPESHADATGSAGSVSPITIDVNPPQLEITDPEIAALAEMDPLISTPRAAKRMMNLYRLIRAGLSDAEVEALVDQGWYRALAIVLAAQVGFPRVSTAFLAELVRSEDTALTITQRLTALPSHRPAAGRPDDSDWGSLRTALQEVCTGENGAPRADMDVSVANLVPWLPRLRRYSFEGALGVGGAFGVGGRVADRDQ